MRSAQSFSLLWFGQRWDKYHRRDRELISHLIQYPGVQHILVIEPPFPLTSIANLWRREYDEDGKDTWERILRRGLIWQPEPGVWVASPLVPVPGARHAVSRLYNVSRRLTARVMLRRLNIQRPVLWLGGPYFTSPLIGHFGEGLLCYSLCEDFREKDPANREMIRSEDTRLSKEADLIFVVSEELAQQRQECSDKVSVVPNGVDVEFVTSRKNNVSLPQEFATVQRPIIGFAGGINENIDLDLVFYLAQERPDWSIVMIGPLSSYARAVARQHSLANLHSWGSRPFEDVPAYVDNFDVCILPYKENARNRRVSSMKLYIYLALGKPVVARPVADAERFGNVVALAREKQAFLRAIETSLANDCAEARQARISVARAQGWDKRAKEIHRLIVRALQKKQIENARNDPVYVTRD